MLTRCSIFFRHEKRPITSKVGILVTKGNGLSSIKSDELLSRGHMNSNGKLETLYLLFYKN